MDLRLRLKYALKRRTFRELGVEDTFTRVYAEGWWGSKSDFDSGEGSEHSAFVEPYTELVQQFIRTHDIKVIVDLGCGDFRVGKRIVEPDTTYIGVDVVRPLIQRNRSLFETHNISFQHCNLVDDQLPLGDLALVRQVFQHLSNAEIEEILSKLSQYRYAIVTEHIASGGDRPNRDKHHGPDVRANRGSGVFIDLPPFSQPCTTVLELPYRPGQVLRSSLIVNSD